MFRVAMGVLLLRVHVAYHSTLTADEVVSRFESQREFDGHVRNGSFELTRMIDYRNSFVPLVTGRVETINGGAVVFATIGLHPGWAFVYRIWLLLAYSSALLIGVAAVTDGTGSVEKAAILLAFPALMTAPIQIGYWPETLIAKELIEKILDSNAKQY